MDKQSLCSIHIVNAQDSMTDSRLLAYSKDTVNSTSHHDNGTLVLWASINCCGLSKRLTSSCHNNLLQSLCTDKTLTVDYILPQKVVNIDKLLTLFTWLYFEIYGEKLE